MPQHTVATTEPFLDLVGIPGLPTTLPLNTTISCDVTASGSGDDGEEISITQPTGTVTVVADTGQTGRFIDSSFSIDLNDGAGIASIETVGDYETIVWSVVEDVGKDYRTNSAVCQFGQGRFLGRSNDRSGNP